MIHRKVSVQDENLKNREHNLFVKKVPKDAEACNIQVATCKALSRTFVAFVRLTKPVLLADFCEIEKPTRFLVIILGPEGHNKPLLALGRSVGSLMSDPLFCQMTAYKASTREELVSGLGEYMAELTVMPPSWDSSTRLDPPKSSATPQSRLVARQEMKEWIKRNNVTEDAEDEDNSHVLMPEQPDHTEDDALKFTGRLFGGLVLDVKRKLPWFASDFKDALHIQTLASIIYIYLGNNHNESSTPVLIKIRITFYILFTLYLILATVTKAITFGGFLGDITDGLQVIFRSNNNQTSELSDPGRAGVIPGPPAGRGRVLPVRRAAPHRPGLHWARPHLREDPDGLLPLLRDDLPHHPALDRALVRPVLHRHRGRGWLCHRQVRKS